MVKEMKLIKSNLLSQKGLDHYMAYLKLKHYQGLYTHFAICAAISLVWAGDNQIRVQVCVVFVSY